MTIANQSSFYALLCRHSSVQLSDINMHKDTNKLHHKIMPNQEITQQIITIYLIL